MLSFWESLAGVSQSPSKSPQLWEHLWMFFVLRKLRVPGHEELAFGAIGGGGVRVLDPDVIESLGLSRLDVELVTSAEKRGRNRRKTSIST